MDARGTEQNGVRTWETTRAFCRRCGGAVRPEGTVRRTVLTLFGRVSLARRRFRCQQCHHRFCPSGELFQGLQMGRVTASLRDAAILAGASWPYRHAAATLQRLSGAEISAEEVRLLTNQQGRQAARQQAEQAEAYVPSVPAASGEAAEAKELCVIGQDGGWVCNREKRGGMEGKIAVIACGQEKGKEPEMPSEEMTWYEVGKYLRNHRHPPRQRSRVERAVSLVINRRMKRRGMRWFRKNATAVVALRVDLLNHDWQRPRAARLFP